MENDRIAKRIYVGVCGGSCSMGRLQKNWIYSMKDSLKKRDLDVSQAMRMVHDKSEWWAYVRGNAWGMKP